MQPYEIINGFSRLSRSEKVSWLERQAGLSGEILRQINGHLHPDPELQEIYGEISENTISNYFLPLGIAPNFLVNERLLAVPMVIEESSVVAAASHAAKFWARHGGFHATVRDTVKVGQVHLTWTGSPEQLEKIFDDSRKQLLEGLKPLTLRMENRGGGIREMELRQGSRAIPGYYQLFVTFRTADAMGANFINSVLETLARDLRELVEQHLPAGELEVVMSILSNYTPESLVTCQVESTAEVFNGLDPALSGEDFARKFVQAVEIAEHDPYRAVTHNKGIFNGMDAVILATGNDFRAVEACGHAYAARKGQYTSLSRAELNGKRFKLTLEVPLAVGTVGGLTGTHPMARASLEILGNPSAEGLMEVIATAGLANHFSAIRSLVTTGIQKGHMKMHLGNILRQLGASEDESRQAIAHFSQRTVSHSEVRDFLESLRMGNRPV